MKKILNLSFTLITAISEYTDKQLFELFYCQNFIKNKYYRHVLSFVLNIIFFYKYNISCKGAHLNFYFFCSNIKRAQ